MEKEHEKNKMTPREFLAWVRGYLAGIPHDKQVIDIVSDIMRVLDDVTEEDADVEHIINDELDKWTRRNLPPYPYPQIPIERPNNPFNPYPVVMYGVITYPGIGDLTFDIRNVSESKNKTDENNTE